MVTDEHIEKIRNRKYTWGRNGEYFDYYDASSQAISDTRRLLAYIDQLHEELLAWKSRAEENHRYRAAGSNPKCKEYIGELTAQISELTQRAKAAETELDVEREKLKDAMDALLKIRENPYAIMLAMKLPANEEDSSRIDELMRERANSGKKR